MTDIAMFSLWRMNCTPSEKLAELAQYSALRPDSVKSVIVIYQDAKGNRHLAVDSAITIAEAIFLLEATKLEMMSNA